MNKTKEGIDITPESLLEVVKKALPAVKITNAEESTLKSMLAEFIETEDWRPGNDICDFLGIERPYNKTDINNAVFDFINGK